ncbi:rCG26604 [Rattus norvegicus]|uniref:RCG26604 n=1 Tax=Rattus norvegicus TaxID=10116 RepID=A6HMB6_RAT|nr:rCG26604 [Rattus norvegicus]
MFKVHRREADGCTIPSVRSCNWLEAEKNTNPDLFYFQAVDISSIKLNMDTKICK